ncbi:hypothetical protein BD309DRAFT_607767 [Dichomitus squalens]|nr:hypothetical protein BD309DRAFT_607767 [Dichomitus squalens]
MSPATFSPTSELCDLFLNYDLCAPHMDEVEQGHARPSGSYGSDSSLEGIGTDLESCLLPAFPPPLSPFFGVASLPPPPTEEVRGISQLVLEPMVGGGSLGLDILGVPLLSEAPETSEPVPLWPQPLPVYMPPPTNGPVGQLASEAGDASRRGMSSTGSPYQSTPPSRRVRIKRDRRKHSPYATPCLTPSSSISSPPSSAPVTPAPQAPELGISGKPHGLGLKISRPRNVQVDARSSLPDAAAHADAWQCPHCDFVQLDRSRSQLKRHIRTHTANVWDWVCTGVPQSDAAKYGLSQDQVDAYVRDGRVMRYDGRDMVGGCGQAITSRKDALKRHLKSAGCPGDHNGEWLLGNKRR